MINGVPRILIIRLSAIGDVVRVLPALQALRDRYPDAQIDWAVEPKSKDILEGHPALDSVLVFERIPGLIDGTRVFRQFCQTIRKNYYDIAIDFHGLIKSGLLLKASRAKERYAFSPPRSQEMSHLFANNKVKLISQRMNRIEENLELCKALGAKSHDLDVIIQVSDEIQEHVEGWFHESFHGAKKVIALHAPVDRPEKQWPLEYFAKLADMLLADGRFEVLLTWGPGQLEIAKKIEALALRNPGVAPETPDLKHLAALLQQTDIFFGGDTGPMHIASAMGTPVVAVFGGTDPARHSPLRKPNEILYAGPDTPPKNVELEDAQNYMSQITPEMAYDACVRLRLS
jgi:lipopolysaccharide heptosyltransferase I